MGLTEWHCHVLEPYTYISVSILNFLLHEDNYSVLDSLLKGKPFHSFDIAMYKEILVHLDLFINFKFQFTIIKLFLKVK